MNDDNYSLILAPIRGITNFIYRNALHHHFGGVDSALAPYIAPKAGKEFNPRQLADVHPKINEIKITGQVLTKNPEQFLEIAHIFKEQGIKEINLNMGCPYPMVANRMKGSGLLPHPEIVEKLLTEIIKKCPLPFSVKLRLGRENSSELEKLIPIINKLDIATIIHPRTGSQLYKGYVDLEAFEKLHTQLSKPPCYNGDITTVSEFLNLKARFPTIKNWMIGRGVLNNPALFSQIRGQEYTKVFFLEKLFLMHQDLMDGYLSLPNGKSDFLNKMKGQWFYLSNCFENSHKVMKKIKKAKNIHHYNDALKWAFNQELDNKIT